MNQPRYAHVAILVPKMAFFCEGQWFLNLLRLVPIFTKFLIEYKKNGFQN